MAMHPLITKVKCQCSKPREHDEIITWHPRTYKCIKTTCLNCGKLIRITSAQCSSYLQREEVI